MVTQAEVSTHACCCRIKGGAIVRLGGMGVFAFRYPTKVSSQGGVSRHASDDVEVALRTILRNPVKL
jgi:hypothetical protein